MQKTLVRNIVPTQSGSLLSMFSDLRSTRNAGSIIIDLHAGGSNQETGDDALGRDVLLSSKDVS